MNSVKLENVVDIRTNKFHSVAIIEERKAKYFIPYVEENPVEKDENE